MRHNAFCLSTQDYFEYHIIPWISAKNGTAFWSDTKWKFIAYKPNLLEISEFVSCKTPGGTSMVTGYAIHEFSN